MSWAVHRERSKTFVEDAERASSPSLARLLYVEAALSESKVLEILVRRGARHDNVYGALLGETVVNLVACWRYGGNDPLADDVVRQWRDAIPADYAARLGETREAP